MGRVIREAGALNVYTHEVFISPSMVGMMMCRDHILDGVFILDPFFLQRCVHFVSFRSSVPQVTVSGVIYMF
jgi:hypothetical protein